MHLSQYFKNFQYENKPRKDKPLPFVRNYDDFSHLLQYKYTIKDFRDIMKRFDFPKCKETKRNKIQMFCTNMIFLSQHSIKIQKLWRNHFIRSYNKTVGPSYRKFELSNNIDDFLTTEKIKDIDYYYYFSFRDKDNFIYTFHLVSIISLLDKNIKKNPYNRSDFDETLICCLRKRMRYNKILKKTQEFQNYKSEPTSINDRVNHLFHHMDQLGNYTSSSWFNHLRMQDLRIFIFELYEIWNYRAQLSMEIKEMICPPRGNPFSALPRNFITNYNNPRMFYSNSFLKSAALNIMEKLAYSAHNDTNKNMGVLYILSALTLVSEPARQALPWLYASVQYM